MAEKLAHAYELLVPDQVRPIRADAGHPAGNQEVLTDETGGIVRACIVRSPEENHTISSQLAALVEYADNRGYLVPPEWRFQDEGYSGATLLRPGLEALRDLAAAGHIQAVLVFSPDRLSRKYAYQVLLTEELSRYGVEVVFLKAPSGETPEDQLLVQFQGMIAEYGRAQIAERSRRGKRHRAQQGSINVLSGAPYGYRYIKKSDTTAAYYEVFESEAPIVRLVYEAYTQQGLRHQRDRPHAQPTADSDPDWDHTLGTIDGLGSASQPGVLRSGMLRQDRAPPATANHAAAAAAQWNGQPQQRQSRTLAPGLDRNRCSRVDQRGNIRFGSGAVGAEQTALAAAHLGALLVTGDAGLRTLRLRPLPHFNANLGAQALLLPVHRL